MHWLAGASWLAALVQDVPTPAAGEPVGALGHAPAGSAPIVGHVVPMTGALQNRSVE